MILFDNETQIKWDHDNHLGSKVKKIKNSILSKSNVEIWNFKKIIKLKKKDLILLESTCQFHDIIMQPK